MISKGTKSCTDGSLPWRPGCGISLRHGGERERGVAETAVYTVDNPPLSLALFATGTESIHDVRLT